MMRGWAWLAAGILFVGCGDAATDNTTPAPTGGTAASGSGGGFSSNAASSGSGVDNECATAVITGQPVPVTMYIMFDKSGSMLDNQKWAGAKAALIAFFQDDDSAGLNIALRFFPDDDPVAGCNEETCDVTACATPLVDAGVLNELPAHSDPQQKLLVEAVDGKEPNGQTPMFAALAGAEQWALDHLTEDERTVVVLVTDGEPNGCNQDIDDIASLASGPFDDSGVLTYAIGIVGANQSQLDQIAAAGGSEQALMVGEGSVHKDLSAALEKIRTTQLDCSFAMPEAETATDVIDPKRVNVSYSTGGASETIAQVSAAPDCDSSGGWYYDNPTAPTQIELCPASCDDVQGNADAIIEIVLGCETVVK